MLELVDRQGSWAQLQARGQVVAQKHPRWFRLLNQLQMADPLAYGARLKILRLMGGEVDSDVHVNGAVYFSQGVPSIAAGVGIHSMCFMDCSGGLTLAENVQIGPGCKIITTSHEIGASDRRASKTVVRKALRIGRGAWLGAGVVVLADIADGCLIGGGALVAESTRPNGLYLGVPARRVRDLS